MKNNILITSAGRRVSLVKAFQKELKTLFNKAIVVTSDADPKMAAACSISDLTRKSLRIDDERYIENLLSICIENEIGLIIPTIDTELQILAQNKNLFGLNGIEIVVSEEDFIVKCRDKRKISSFFESKKIKIPRPIDPYFNPNFPIFAKPYNGSLSRGIRLIKSSKELTDEVLDDSELMFMEYLSPAEFDEYTVDLYFGKDCNLKCAVPRKRIEVRGGEISKGITHKNFVLEFVKEKLFNISGARGCITLQVFLSKNSNEIFGIEINPRFGGGYPLSYCAGANFPKFIIEEYFLSKTINYTEDWAENTIMLRYDAEIIKYV